MPHTLLLAEPRGFCAGVKRAIKIVEKSINKYGSPVYVRHEIVHNKQVVEELKQKVADEIKTTFASHYTKEISLAEVLQPENIEVYAKQATGEKYLVNPNK